MLGDNMICESCGAESPDSEGKYCTRCGFPLKSTRNTYLADKYLTERGKQTVVGIEIMLGALITAAIYVVLDLLNVVPSFKWENNSRSIPMLYSIVVLFCVIIVSLNYLFGIENRAWAGKWWETWKGWGAVTGNVIVATILIGFFALIILVLVSGLIPE